ncbi:hypothetical protein SSS_06550 [Sarcoptes scabiei]|uniref:MH2 domain-containing protein n=1 Tax=Sarcoptes scabiei TaxID=52283 RepID=A0A834RFF0_SARSC|nr:hypothetical protein SSS_06550 [Sarcoptes scabiei]
MISRRKILSRSRDELMMNGQYPDNYNPYEEEDVWYSKDKLMKDHILEILNKWEQIDDEIWAKLICMERNRRVAKAYARAPILTINGSEDGFDGYRIGLNGFDNPLRDPKTDAIKHHIGDGVKIRMDDDGNILIKRLAESNVYVKGWSIDLQQSQAQQETYTSVSSEIIRNNGLLEINKAVRLFDMKRFQQNMNRELRRAYPDRRKLENQCICCVGFVKDSNDLLDLPVWIMIINIVAMDMLKSKMPLTISKRQSVPNLVSLFDRQKSTIAEEDPYSIPGNNSSSSGSRSSGHYVSTGPFSSGQNGLNGESKTSSLSPPSSSGGPKPPKLPPRDFERKNKSKLLSTKKASKHNKNGDEENDKNNNNHSNSNNNKNNSDSKSHSNKHSKNGDSNNNNNNNNNSKNKKDENGYSSLLAGNNPRVYDDPYYSGFSARVPNFARKTNGNLTSYGNPQPLMPFKSSYNHPDFHSRKVPTSGFLNSFLKSPNVIHSRTASYQSYYGSLGESDPYTLSSESGTGGQTTGDDYLTHHSTEIYGSHRMNGSSRLHETTNQIVSDKYGLYGITGQIRGNGSGGGNSSGHYHQSSRSNLNHYGYSHHHHLHIIIIIIITIK